MEIKEGGHYTNKYGDDILVLEINKGKCKVSFNNEYIRDGISKRNIMSAKYPKSRTVYNVGYLGEDFWNYKGVSKLKAYVYWRNMIKRCYHEKAQKDNSYNKVIVYEEWHNFSIFYKWYKENYYEIDGEIMCLDKDIKHKKALMYSPETCMFVPSKINIVFEKMNRDKCDNRNNLPLGVQWIEQNKIYGCGCRDGNGGDIWLGRSHDIEELFYRYVNCKKRVIKEIVDSYGDKLPQHVRDNILNYKIEITD